jgi:hypothetical protein
MLEKISGFRNGYGEAVREDRHLTIVRRNDELADNEKMQRETHTIETKAENKTRTERGGEPKGNAVQNNGQDVAAGETGWPWLQKGERSTEGNQPSQPQKDKEIYNI